MRKQGMKRFVLLSLLALLPALLLVAFYIVKDPFHVVKPYKGQVYNPGDTISLTINWGFITVESYKYFDEKEHFDSFIFGSSLSGYYFIKDPSCPLEIYLLQSTSCYDDNVMWKLLNWLLEYSLRERKELTQEQARLGDRQTAPELHIMDKFTLDVRQSGWQIGDEDFLDGIADDLSALGYTITDGVVIVPAGTDYIEFGVNLVKDIKQLL